MTHTSSRRQLPAEGRSSKVAGTISCGGHTGQSFWSARKHLLRCSQQSESSRAQLDEASRALMSQCPLHIRDVLDDGSLAKLPFIRPQHVARLDAASKSYSEEGPGILVTLTPDGEDRMRGHSERRVEHKVAVFCGMMEISRPTISAPFSNHFKVEISEEEA